MSKYLLVKDKITLKKFFINCLESTNNKDRNNDFKNDILFKTFQNITKIFDANFISDNPRFITKIIFINDEKVKIQKSLLEKIFNKKAEKYFKNYFLEDYKKEILLSSRKSLFYFPELVFFDCDEEKQKEISKTFNMFIKKKLKKLL